MATAPRVTGVDWDLVNEDAANWARDYGGQLVKDIDTTTRRDVGNAVANFYEQGQTMGELGDRLGRIYSPQRAERIAITEVTRAAAQGERGMAKELAKDGIVMVEVWQTRNDSVVCDICRPRNGVEEGKGSGDAYWDKSMGPPGHPRCRCNVRHELPKLGEDAIEVDQVSGEPPQFTSVAEAREWAKNNNVPIYSDVDDIIDYQWQRYIEEYPDRTGPVWREKFYNNWHKHLEAADDKYLLEGHNAYSRALSNGSVGDDVAVIMRKPTSFNSFEDDVFVQAYYLEEEQQIVMLQDKYNMWNREPSSIIPKRYRSNADEAYQPIEGTLVHEYGHHASVGKIPDIDKASSKWFVDNSIDDTEDWIKNNISSYATENVKELTAESYALYSHPEYSTLKPDVRSFISTIVRFIK